MCSQSKTIVQGDGTFAKRIAAGKCPKCKTVFTMPDSYDQDDYWECTTCSLKMKYDDLK